MSNNGLDDPVPSEQPPAKPAVKKAAKKVTMIILPGAYVDLDKELKTKKGDPMHPLVFGEYSTMLFENDQYEMKEDGLHVTDVVKGRNWKMANSPYDPVTWAVVEAQIEGAVPAPIKTFNSQPTQAMVEKKAQPPAIPQKQPAPQSALKTLPSRGQFYKPEGNKEVPDAWEIQKHANEMGLACQVMEMGRTEMGAFAKVRVFKPEIPQQFIEAEVYYDYSIMLEKLTLDALAKTRIHPTGFDEKGKPILNNQDALYLYGLWVRKKQFADRQCETQAFARAQYKFLNHEWRESVEKEIEQEEIADVKALKEAPKKSFPVKMPAKEPETKMATEDLTALPVVPYSTASPITQAQAEQNEEAEIEAIINEQPQPEEEEPPAEAPKKEDVLTLMNKLKDAINVGRPKEQTIGLPIIKKGIDKLSKVSNLTPADQAKALLGMDLSMAKLLLGVN